MHELHKKGEKKEASAMAKLLAAEEALSTSLWWSLPQKKKIKGRYAVTEMLEIDCWAQDMVIWCSGNWASGIDIPIRWFPKMQVSQPLLPHYSRPSQLPERKGFDKALLRDNGG